MKWEEVIKSQDIRRIYRDAEIEKIQHLPPQILDFGRRWVSSKNPPSIFITGSVGSGKTYFMTALLRELVKKGHSWFRFTRSVDLFDLLLQEIMNRKSNNHLLRSIAEVPYLFLDDVGVEGDTERIKKEYFSIIDYRVGEMLPFVFTSNMTKDEFGQHLGERVASRMHGCVEIEFPKIDLRTKINHFQM